MLGSLELLSLAVERWPWIAPCLALPATEQGASHHNSVPDALRGRLAILPGGDTPASVTPQHVATAVALREPPTPHGLARWAASRLAAIHVLEPLEELFRHALDPLRPSKTRTAYSRLFGEISELTARDWRAVARLATALHAAAHQKLVRHADPRAATIPVSRRTVQRYAQHYLDMTWTTASALVGWEWVLECALSRRQSA